MPRQAHRSEAIVPDLVGYLVVAVPHPDALADLVPALTGLVGTATIRILDLVVVERGLDGAVEVRELEAVESLAGLRAVEGDVGGLLSDHDVELAAYALRPGTCGVVLVTEDRWAGQLSQAAQGAGGRIVAGERIPPARVEDVLADRHRGRPEGA